MVKLSSIVGLTCLGEYLPLESIVFLSQEKATVGSKKRKFPSTSLATGLDSDKAEDPMTATPGNINMTANPGNVTPTATPRNINPTATPGNVTPTATPSNINPTATPSNVILTATPSNVNKVVQLQEATPSLVWPSDLILILQRIAATPCHQPTKSLFAFDFSLEAANKNFILIKHNFGGDLQKALLAQSDSLLGYGLEFKPIKMLEPIFKNHPSWSRMKQVLTNGSKWPLQPLNEENQIKDIEEALLFSNHKGAVKQQDLLRKLVTDDVVRGFALLLPLNKIAQILGVLLAPLNIQAQNTINERGEIIPKNGLTHDQSWKWQSGTSVNSRVNADKLMPCYFGRAMQRLINWTVAARKLYPNRRILATKLDVKAAYQRCHLNVAIAIQTCTQLPSKGLALMMLWLTFGGAPCPLEWGSITESICDLANAILLSDD